MIMSRTLTQKINTTYSVTADRTTPKQIYEIDSNEQKLLRKTREQLTNRKMAATADLTDVYNRSNTTHTVTRRLAGTDQRKRVSKGLTENRTQDCSMEWRGRQKNICVTIKHISFPAWVHSCMKFYFKNYWKKNRNFT
ncbi:hypothetical protein M9H77_21080 [Catharanthus roseus]|uniref:Uncharacterized protein n=1 Tax=Catharanthus roseus TaxID=4058 RepID=A0ACC0AP25_CATRO|nr:hypothetical protein M9H77_21080 [Catharanthus roseus]